MYNYILLGDFLESQISRWQFFLIVQKNPNNMIILRRPDARHQADGRLICWEPESTGSHSGDNLVDAVKKPLVVEVNQMEKIGLT